MRRMHVTMRGRRSAALLLGALCIIAGSAAQSPAPSPSPAPAPSPQGAPAPAPAPAVVPWPYGSYAGTSGPLLPPDFQRSFTFANGNWCPNVKFSDPRSDRSLVNLRVMTHANWVTVLVTWFTHTYNTTMLYPRDDRTATDDELAHVIAKAKSLGMKVMLKLHIDMDMDPDNTVYWRGNIGQFYSSNDVNDFFRNYRVFLRHYAGLAESLSIDLLCVGTELVALDIYDAQWRQVVGDARALYSGKLTYAANWWGDTIFGAQYTPLNVTWWDTLDLIGVDAYFPLAPKGSDPSFDDLVAGWSHHVPLLQQLSQKYNKDLIFTELGYVSAAHNSWAPNAWNLTWAVNMTAQVAAYEAFFVGVAAPYSGGPGSKGSWFKGVHWWVWLTDPATGGDGDWRNLYTPQHKPVLRVLRKWYSNEGNYADTLPASGRTGSRHGSLGMRRLAADKSGTQAVTLGDDEVAKAEGLDIQTICDGCPFKVDKPFSCDVVAALT